MLKHVPQDSSLLKTQTSQFRSCQAQIQWWLRIFRTVFKGTIFNLYTKCNDNFNPTESQRTVSTYV